MHKNEAVKTRGNPDLDVELYRMLNEPVDEPDRQMDLALPDQRLPRGLLKWYKIPTSPCRLLLLMPKLFGGHRKKSERRMKGG